jgi:hypothetical protein
MSAKVAPKAQVIVAMFVTSNSKRGAVPLSGESPRRLHIPDCLYLLTSSLPVQSLEHEGNQMASQNGTP